jgi:tetratricopeptide (TPR) repeat protein
VRAALAQTAQEASPPSTLQGHINAGVRLFAEGRYDEAILAFTEAYRMRPIPRLLFNIAQSHRKAGRPKEALEAYEQFLREETQDTTLRTEAEGYLAQVRADLAPPPPPPPPPAAISAPAPVRPPPRPPLRRRGWFIAVVSVTAAALAGTAIGLGVGLRDPAPPTTLGTIDPF